MRNTVHMKRFRLWAGAGAGLLKAIVLMLAVPASAANHPLGWGLNGSEQASPVPTNAMTDVATIAAGHYHSLALKNGRVWAWGDNSAGQIDVPVAAQSAVSNMAAGAEFSMALRNDGSVVVWGADIVRTNMPAAATSGVSQVAAGEAHALALKDGAVIAWGANTYGQCDVPAELTSGVSAISAGGYYSLALKNGGVHVFGISSSNPLSYSIRDVPLTATSGVSAIAAGHWHGLALKNGGVIAWGTPQYGATNVPAAATSGVTAMAAGNMFSIALKTNGTLVIWGDDFNGQTNIPSFATSGVTRIAAGFGHCLAICAGMPPRMFSTLLPDAYRTYPYSHTLSATGDPRVVFSGSLPGWLNLNANSGSLIGTPTTLGMNYLTIVTTNIHGKLTNSFTINVLERPPEKPVFVTTSPLPNGTVGVSYSRQIVASNNPVFSLVSGGGSLPAGLTLSTNGLISGIPATEEVRQFTVRATNVVGASTRVYQITILQPTEPPVFVTTSPLPSGTVGQPYSRQIVANNGPTFSLLAGSLPDGLELTPSGLLNGTPILTGAYTFTLLATNAAGASNRVYDLEIRGPPALLTESPLPNGGLYAPYSVQLEATGNPVFSLESGNPPAGLTLSAGGLLTGVPTVLDTFYFTVQVTNSYGSASRMYELTIEPPEGPPFFVTTSPLSEGVVAQSYSFQVEAGNFPSAITLYSGALPAGLNLSAAGLVSGTPTSAGTFNFTLRATNMWGWDDRAFDLQVYGPPVFLTPSPLPQGILNVSYSLQLQASEADAFSIVAGTLAGGLGLSADGLISGTPTVATNWNFTVRATNDYGWTNRVFALSIQSILLPPEFTFIRWTNTGIRLEWSNPNPVGVIQVWRATNITKPPVPWTNLGAQTSPWTNVAPPMPSYYQLRAVP